MGIYFSEIKHYYFKPSLFKMQGYILTPIVTVLELIRQGALIAAFNFSCIGSAIHFSRADDKRFLMFFRWPHFSLDPRQIMVILNFYSRFYVYVLYYVQF